MRYRGAARRQIRIDCIQPGKQQRNTCVERFNRAVRSEWLSQYDGENLEDMQLFATRWMYGYNHARRHMASSGFAPKRRLAMAA